MSETTMNVKKKRRLETKKEQEGLVADAVVGEATAAVEEGRDADGRFAAGNGGGPGNPFARQVAQLRSALIARVSSKDIGDIADALLLKARTGDLAASKLLLQYVIGKPAAAVNPDALDIDEYRQIYAPQSEMLRTMPNAMQSFPAGVMSMLVRIINEQYLSRLQKLLALPQEEFVQAAENPERFFGGEEGEDESEEDELETDDLGDDEEVVAEEGAAEQEADTGERSARGPSTNRRLRDNEGRGKSEGGANRAKGHGESGPSTNGFNRLASVLKAVLSEGRGAGERQSRSRLQL